MAALMPEGKQSFTNSAGAPLVGGKIYTYDAGTNTPRPTYQDAAGAVPNTNPIVLDARGEATVFWNGTYKVVLKDAADATIWTVDNVTDSFTQSSAAAAAALLAFTVNLLSQIGATLVGYWFGALGSVYRLLQDKLRETVSVKDFGAKGDGVTDDYPAFVLAANYIAASAKGVNLYIPDGTYLLSATPTFLTTKSFTIYGNGDSSILRLNAGGGAAVLTLGSASINPTRQAVKSLFFQGPVTGVSNGINATNCNTLRLEDNVFQSQVTGVQLNSCYAVELTSNVFDVCTTYGVYSSTSCHNLVAKKNNFFTCGVSGGGHAINVSVGSDNLVFNDNDFEYCNVAFRLNNCTAVTINGNYIEYCASSMFDFIGVCRGVSITSNWLALGTLSTTIANVNGGILKYNTVYNQTIGVAASCVDFVVGRNYKYGTGTMPQSSWTTPVLSGTFGQQGAYYTAQYIKDDDNRVHLRGNLLAGVAGSQIFNLPAGYRPGSPVAFATASSAGPGLSIVEVRTNGDVWCIVRDSAGGTGLNGVSFEAQN